MAGKSGKRITGNKPSGSRRQSAKTDGAFGKEQVQQVSGNGPEQNVDKTVRKKVRTGRAGA